ncbi:MAG: hypothetical protein WCX46_01540 [Candidatus Paceibacterota bacterium]
MFFSIALLIGVIGAAVVFISKDSDTKRKITAFVILVVVYTLIGWWLFWGVLFSTAWPLLGGYVVILLVWWIISAFITSVLNDYGDIEWVHAFWFPIVLFVIITIIGMTGWNMFNSGDYSSLIGKFDTKNQKHWSKEIQPLDPTHLRLVPDSVAIYLAKTALAEDGITLGSQFPLAEEYLTLQKINSDYFYLIPLDFKGWKVWTNTDGVPAYVKVSATDPNAKPILVDGKKMKYTPNAFFGDNLERKLYSKYYNKVLIDYSFEEDDNGNIFWVVTTCKPTISYWGLVADGVIIFNPETGDDEFVDIKKIESDSSYAWIDRVIPVSVFQSYIDYWGSLKDGWWNSFWTHLNILESETPTMNYSSDGRCVFVAPVTSDNNNDQAMTGLMYCDARTGEVTYYTTSGGATEEDIIDAVNAEVKFKQWHASEQIIYENVYGQLAALVPVLGGNGTYQSLAIVRTDNRKVALGKTAAEALVEFQKLIMNVGGQITTENAKDVLEYEGVVSRVGWETSSTGKQYYLYFKNFSYSFMVVSTVQSELALTKEGDLVFLRYINSKQASVPVTYFKNLTLDLKISSNEASVNSQMQQRKDTLDIKSDVKDFKEKIKTMSDKEIMELQNK